MSVRDERRPPFAWIALEALRRVRRDLPAGRHGAARNALLALSEAASLRRDGAHREGDTLAELSGLSGVSERRLRDHLRDLESIGLIRVERTVDEHGRDLPTTYVLAGSDDSSDRPDELSDGSDAAGDKSSDPTRARPDAVKEEEELPPPTPPGGSRARDRERWMAELRVWSSRHFPGVDVGYVIHAMSLVGVRGRPPTVEELRPIVERWTEESAEIAASPASPSDPAHRMTGVGHPRQSQEALL